MGHAIGLKFSMLGPAKRDGRVNRRNRYRTGTSTPGSAPLDVAVPKLREGTYFSDWLLERRRRT